MYGKSENANLKICESLCLMDLKSLRACHYIHGHDPPSETVLLLSFSVHLSLFNPPSFSRSRETENMEYLKNVIIHYMCADSGGREQMVTPIATILHFSPEEVLYMQCVGIDHMSE